MSYVYVFRYDDEECLFLLIQKMSFVLRIKILLYYLCVTKYTHFTIDAEKIRYVTHCNK